MKQGIRFPLPELLCAAIVAGMLSVLAYEEIGKADARRRSMAMTGLAGSLRSGAALAHSIWLTNGANSSVITLASEKAIEIDPVTGYPSATRRGIRGVVNNLTGFAAAHNGTSYVFSIAGVPSATCNVTYVTGFLIGEPPKVTVRNNGNGGDCG